MIIPLIEETEWRTALNALPLWRPPAVPTIVISPHPDDETLGAGGLIHSLTAQSIEVSIIAVTDGENAYEGVRGLGSIRETEQTLALSVLGVPQSQIHRLRFPDSGLSGVETSLFNAIARYVQPEMHIVAPWMGDFHPDHEACGRVARILKGSIAVTLTYYFFWTWHRGDRSTLEGLPLTRFPLSEEEIELKNKALACHQSQLNCPSGDPILPPNLLGPMLRPYEVYLPA